jgi:hypothetical protein
LNSLTSGPANFFSSGNVWGGDDFAAASYFFFYYLSAINPGIYLK